MASPRVTRGHYCWLWQGRSRIDDAARGASQQDRVIVALTLRAVMPAGKWCNGMQPYHGYFAYNHDGYCDFPLRGRGDTDN